MNVISEWTEKQAYLGILTWFLNDQSELTCSLNLGICPTIACQSERIFPRRIFLSILRNKRERSIGCLAIKNPIKRSNSLNVTGYLMVRVALINDIATNWFCLEPFQCEHTWLS